MIGVLTVDGRRYLVVFFVGIWQGSDHRDTPPATTTTATAVAVAALVSKCMCMCMCMHKRGIERMG